MGSKRKGLLLVTLFLITVALLAASCSAPAPTESPTAPSTPSSAAPPKPTAAAPSTPSPTPLKSFSLVFEAAFPSTHSDLGEAPAPAGLYLKAVEAASNGRIKFERHWGGEPVPNLEMMRAVGKGTLDVILSYAPYYTGDVTIGDVFSMPMNFRTATDFYDLWWNSRLSQLINSAYEKRANARLFFPALSSPNVFHIGKKTPKLTKIEDLKGLKIRSSGGRSNDIIKFLGGVPVQLITGDYFIGMQKGTVDAGIQSVTSLENYKLWDVTHQVIYPPIISRSLSSFWMNLDKWNQLGPDLQKVFIDAGRKMEADYISAIDGTAQKVEALAKSEHGVEFYTLPPAEEQKMWALTAGAWDSYVADCKKQGFGDEAQQIRDLLAKRFLGR